ncbi:hypothetical protein [Streptomyces canus]|uniref:hypothetical protein n=1 Tax=Streptomyces canus TaxID=58343 RepID=UPI003CF57A7E
MIDPVNEGRLLYYAQDIITDDVEGLESFLMARTAGLARAERGSDERQTARALRAAMVVLVGTLQHSLMLAEPVARADPVLHRQITVSWNALVATASPWQGRDDYDGERWRPVKYWDADHESEVEGLLSAAFRANRGGGSQSGE